MGAEIPVWVGGLVKWISGVTKRTTCDDVVQAVIASSECSKVGTADHQQYVIVERWRKVERPLEGKSRILKVWKTWGDEQCNVRLLVKKVAPDSPTRETRAHHHRKRHAKGCRNPRTQTCHPRKLRGGGTSEDLADPQCPDMAIASVLRVLRTQNETLANQRLRLQEKDTEIELYETKMHLMRMRESGANYVQDAYLGPLDPAEPTALHHLEGPSPSLDETIQLYEKLLDVCRRLEREEASIADLSARIRETMDIHNQNRSDDHVVADIADEIRRTKDQIEEQTKTAEQHRLTLAQNEAVLRESERILADRKRVLRHTEVDLDHADQEFARLQRNLEAIRSPAEAEPPQVNGTAAADRKSESTADSNSDTGISSLHSSSSDEGGGGGCMLDTLV